MTRRTVKKTVKKSAAPKAHAMKKPRNLPSGPTKQKSKEQEEVENAFPEVSQNPYGDWLRRSLDDADMKPWELADESGVSLPQIYNILSGRSLNPQQRTREKLQSALGSSPTESDLAVETPQEEITPNMGDLIDFDPHDETLLPECSGVYVFYDVTDRPVYVGKAFANGRTIRVRVKEHYEKFWFKRPIVNNGAYIRITDEILCASVEKALIRFLKTNAVLNKKYVDREK